jgi:hypothetical protein
VWFCNTAFLVLCIKEGYQFFVCHVTVTSTEEALIAAQAGADALCVQGRDKEDIESHFVITYGDLHANGRDGVEFYTRKKMVTAKY